MGFSAKLKRFGHSVSKLFRGCVGKRMNVVHVKEFDGNDNESGEYVQNDIPAVEKRPKAAKGQRPTPQVPLLDQLYAPMRVLETGGTQTYAMGKNRKHKVRKVKDNDAHGSDSSEDGAPASGCPHITKAVNFAAMRKGIQKATFGECTGCNKALVNSVHARQPSPILGASGSDNAEDDLAQEDADPSLWVCLQCGYQGCGRNSRSKHAFVHFETPRSARHCVVINTTAWSAWCYDCDDALPIEKYKRLLECVDFLRKQSDLPDGFLGAKVPCHGIMHKTIPTSRSEFVSTSGACVMSPPIENNVASVKESAKTKNSISRSSSAPCQKVKGLTNLGNTCFFNAVMQNMSQCYSLENLLSERIKKGYSMSLAGRVPQPDSDISSGSEEDGDEPISKDMGPIHFDLPDSGPFSQSLLSFLHDMNNTGKSGTVSPTSLFGQVCKKAPRFRGQQQQDSHELLRLLLDAMRTEEIKRTKVGILKHFKVSGNVNPKKVDEDTKIKVKEFGHLAKHTFIDSLFGGQLLSTVMCEECHSVSQIFEEFLDLSLPVTEEKPQRLVSAKKKENTEEAKGVDGFAERSDRPSKYLEKKLKQQARRGKKKGRKKPDSLHSNSTTSVGDHEAADGDADLEEDESEIKENGELTKEGHDKGDNPEESQGSNREDTSDADVEDNAESDTTRTKKFGFPPVGHTLSAAVHTNGVYLEKESLDSGLDTLKSSTSTLETSGKQSPLGSIYKSDSENKALLESVTVGMGSVTISEKPLPGSFKTCDMSPQKDNEIVNSNSVLLENDVNRTSNISQNMSNLIKPDIELTGVRRMGDVRCRLNSDTEFKTRKEIKREANLKSMSTLSSRYQPVSRECSILSCLNQFTAAELLTGSNKVTCANCTRQKRKNSKKAGKADPVLTIASKQYLIFQPPAVLTLHLKRFEQIGYNTRKVNRHVDFPLLLDLSPFCSALCQGIRKGQKKTLYSLYGVVEHSGRLSGGHYTAYVKVRPNIGNLLSYLQTSDVDPKEYVRRYTEQIMKGSQDPAPDDHLGDDASLVVPGRWFHISDSRINEVTETSVQQAQAYLLFYERVY